MDTSQCQKLKRPIVLRWGTVEQFEEIYSSLQGCFFLLAQGFDWDGEPFEEPVSVNIPSKQTPPHHYWVRIENHHADLVAKMRKRGILKDANKYHQSGWISIPLFKYEVSHDS